MADRPVSATSGSAAGPEWTQLNTLSCASLGSSVIFATDDWFASAENMLSSEAAVWREGFTQQGKWMDGWETRRKRIPGHDWCIIRLGLPGMVHGVQLDTSFFTGNFAPRASVQAARLDSDPVIGNRTGDRGVAASEEQLKSAAELRSDTWDTLVEMTPLGAGYKDTCNSYFTVGTGSGQGPYTHIRLNIFPDGGVARCRVFGIAASSDPETRDGHVDLVSARLGGVCIGYSDAHYGHPRNIIKTEAGVDMGDGWETARRLDRPPVLEADSAGILQVPGHEWAVFRLGLPGTVDNIVVDTNHFKGNFPDSVVIEMANVEDKYPDDKKTLLENDQQWRPLLPASKLKPHHQHQYSKDQLQGGRSIVSHVRVKMFPDGGISRIRIMGSPASS